MKDEAPKQKLKNEVRSVLIRWTEESDLDSQDMLEAIGEIVEEDFEVEEETIEFEPEEEEEI
tara:strand:+ start:278 stop:463 length:186 start_codon:yes stop_codon:yes gene_type:complete